MKKMFPKLKYYELKNETKEKQIASILSSLKNINEKNSKNRNEEINKNFNNIK